MPTDAMVAAPTSSDIRAAQAVIAGGKLRSTLLELWQRTRMDWGFVTDRLSSTFRKEKWIGSADRRFLSETLFGMIRNLRRIDLAIARGSKRKSEPKDLERVVAYLVLENFIDTAAATRMEPNIDWSNALAVDDVIASERNLTRRIALSASLPDWLAQRLVADWGDEAEQLAVALNDRGPMTVRANLLVADRATVNTQLHNEQLVTTTGQWCDTALTIEGKTNLFTSKAFTTGALEAQDEGSQLLADLAVPRDGRGSMRTGIVLDLCAGAGGKTLAVSARMRNKGRVVASDIDGNKLEELRRRARRATVAIVQAAVAQDAQWPALVESMRGKADVVMVDAPCTGLGALRRNPEARFRWRESDINAFAATQRELLQRSFALCAPGGVVVYATCSVLKQENQEVVAKVLATQTSARVRPLAAHAPEMSATFDRDGAFMSVPHRHNTDGFFAQVIEISKG
jgi:16S rRNA (cytosine967-C5)-methyltransferase